MGMLLEDVNKVGEISGVEFWRNTLRNDKVLLDQINRAIVAFTSSSGADGIVEYTIDTGQDRQTVKRTDLASLYARRDKLINEINRIEAALNGGRKWSQVIPGF